MLKRIWMLLLSMFVMITLTSFSVKATDHPLKKGETIEPDGATKNRVISAYGKLPLYFEANEGQVEGTIRFLSHGSGYGLFLTSTEVTLTLTRENQTSEKWGKKAVNHQTSLLRMKWEGANQNPRIEGIDEFEGKSHYFIRNDPDQWRTNIPLYRKVRYRDLYRGIDLFYYGNQRQLEYDLVVAPREDPSAIRLVIEGAEGVEFDERGNLLLRVGRGEVIQHAPRIYQEIEGEKRFIKGGYVVDPLVKNEDKGKVLIGFKIDKFDAEKPLFIDPVLTYSTYLGGSDDEVGNGIAVDSSGNAYITGRTSSTDFPIASFIQGSYAGGYDVFVTKLNSSGSALVYSTYLGGSDDDVSNGIAVDSSGNAYITGYTGSTDFPTASPIQSANGGSYDVFIAKLSPSGSTLVYSTYLGGRCDDEGNGIAVDSSGNAYVTGYTCSTNYPTTANAIQRTYAGGYDVFVTKLNSSGSALGYSTYLGGSDDEVSNGIAVDSSGNAYITGYTGSTDFPTASPIQGTNAGGRDVFVTQLNPSGSALVYSTYLGGSGDDVGNGIAVDSSGNAYITGYTVCTDFPTGSPIQGANAGGYDVFVTKLNPSGSALGYSTYLGGSGDDVGNGIAVDSSGNAYVTGYTLSTNFPAASPIQGTNAGGRDVFVIQLNPSGSALGYSTYLGGSGDDVGNGIAVDSSGNAYITGYTVCTDFPTGSPTQRANAGGILETSDAFVTKITLETISTPTTPSGPTSGTPGTSYSYSTGNSISNIHHTVEYQFDWKGDGSDLSSYGSATQSKTWTAPGTYNVRARARCATDTSVVSDWSSALSVTISAETVSTPDTPTGPTSGITNKSYSYSTGGSTSSLDHAVEYQFDWKGDGSDLSIWGSAIQSKTRTVSGVYNVRARARCATDTSVVSNWSSPLSVSISIPKISVTSTASGFGNVKVKKSKTASFKVKNTGTANLSILTSTITGTDASMFTIKSGGGSKTIKPGKSLTVKVAFKPTSEGAKSANLEITSNDPFTPTVDIPLSGTGQ